MRPQSLKQNNRNKGKGISKRGRKTIKHPTKMNTKVQRDLSDSFQSQNSPSGDIGIEDTSIQPSESISRVDLDGRFNLH